MRNRANKRLQFDNDTSSDEDIEIVGEAERQVANVVPSPTPNRAFTRSGHLPHAGKLRSLNLGNMIAESFILDSCTRGETASRCLHDRQV